MVSCLHTVHTNGALVMRRSIPFLEPVLHAGDTSNLLGQPYLALKRKLFVDVFQDLPINLMGCGSSHLTFVYPRLAGDIAV